MIIKKTNWDYSRVYGSSEQGKDFECIKIIRFFFYLNLNSVQHNNNK